MPLTPWEHLGEETLLRFRVFDVVRCDRRSPRTGKVFDMFTVRTWDWVHIVPVAEDGRLILVRQWRQGSCSMSTELPGGAVAPDEPAADAARRELLEETGYEAAALEDLGWTNPNPAIFTNRCHTFRATGCRLVAGPALDEGEDLEVVLATAAEVEQLVRQRDIHNALVLAGLALHGIS